MGAYWPFLSDHEIKLLHELDLADESEHRFGPVFIPYTFVLVGERTIHKVYNGWWYMGRPTVEEFRMDFRAILYQRPNWEYNKDWSFGKQD